MVFSLLVLIGKERGRGESEKEEVRAGHTVLMFLLHNLAKPAREQQWKQYVGCRHIFHVIPYNVINQKAHATTSTAKAKNRAIDKLENKNTKKPAKERRIVCVALDSELGLCSFIIISQHKHRNPADDSINSTTRRRVLNLHCHKFFFIVVMITIKCMYWRLHYFRYAPRYPGLWTRPSRIAGIGNATATLLLPLQPSPIRMRMEPNYGWRWIFSLSLSLAFHCIGGHSPHLSCKISARDSKIARWRTIKKNEPRIPRILSVGRSFRWLLSR